MTFIVLKCRKALLLLPRTDYNPNPAPFRESNLHEHFSISSTILSSRFITCSCCLLTSFCCLLIASTIFFSSMEAARKCNTVRRKTTSIVIIIRIVLKKYNTSQLLKFSPHERILSSACRVKSLLIILADFTFRRWHDSYCWKYVSLRAATNVVNAFGANYRFTTQQERTKAIWIGAASKNKTETLISSALKIPLNFWTYISLDETENNKYNFLLKIRKMETKLSIWLSRDLTLFGRTLLAKSLGVS